MIKRMLIIRLKKEAPPQKVRALVKTLEEVPHYIPVVKSSAVRRNLSAFPYDLVWEHTFKDQESMSAYFTHPYHCDKLDEFLWKECPSNIIEPPIIHIFFEDRDVSERKPYRRRRN